MPNESSHSTISKKIRFEVFKRDGFKCVYCGKNPPQVVLEVDHIDPKSLGGSGEINNLVTSCFDCNRGKKNIPLDKIPPKLQENLEVLQEQEEQIKAYRGFIKKIERREKRDIDEITLIYSKQYKDWRFSDTFQNVTLKKFLKELPIHEVIESLQIAISRFPSDKDNVIKYFCGICWNKIKSKTDINYEIKRQLLGIWESRPRGSGYLKKGILDYWLKKYSRDQIADAMIKAKGLWSDLKNFLGDM